MADKARVHRRRQTIDLGEPLANQLPLADRLLDQRPRPRITRRVVATLEEDEPSLAECAGVIELALGGRHALAVHTAIVVAEHPEVDRAAPHVLEIDIVHTTVGRRQVLEQKHLKKRRNRGFVDTNSRMARRSSASSRCTLLTKIPSITGQVR
jgi:hypothetical protein